MNTFLCLSRWVRIGSLSAVALLAFDVAHAQTLYKCIAGNDEITIQSQPCPAGSRTDWERPVDPNLQRGHVPVRQPAAPAPRPAPQPATAYSSSPSADERKSSRCNNARRTAAAERDRNWRTITFDRRRQLDDWVREECR